MAKGREFDPWAIDRPSGVVHALTGLNPFMAWNYATDQASFIIKIIRPMATFDAIEYFLNT